MDRYPVGLQHKDAFNQSKHYYCPLLNLNSSNITGHHSFCEFPFRERFPWAVSFYSVFCVGLSSTDASKNFLLKKERWLAKLQQFAHNNKKINDFNDDRFIVLIAMKQLRRFQKQRSTRLSLGLILYLNHLKIEPEPHFTGDHNWLFSGCTLEILTISNKSFLVYSSGSALSTLCLYEINRELKYDSLDVIDYELKIHQPILEIKVENDIICCRQKNNITLFHFNGSNLRLIWKKKIHRPHFFTSICLKNHLVACTTTRRELLIFNESKGRRQRFFLLRGNHKLFLIDQWCQVLWVDDTFWIADRHFLFKLNIEQKSQHSIFAIKDALAHCDIVVQTFNSNLASHLIYIVTKHSLFLFDTLNLMFLIKWVHMMVFPPTNCSSVLTESGEIIVAQSHKMEDIVSFYCEKDLSSFHQPKTVSCLSDTLWGARLCGTVGLMPIVRKRINFSIISVKLLNTNDEAVLLVQNSGGDIFVGWSFNCDNWDSWREYGEQCINKFSVQPFAYSSIIDMSSLLKRLRKPKKIKKPKPTDGVWPREQTYHPESLVLYKDHLVKNLLLPWNLKPRGLVESDWTSDDNDEVQASKMKVSHWFENHAPVVSD